MNYWLTTHDPHPTATHPWHLYMKDKYVGNAAEVRVGDLIAFYELAKGGGRQGVIALGRIAGLREENKFDGGRADREGRPEWRWGWPTDSLDFVGFITQSTLLTLIDHGTIRIPGGLLQLNASQWVALAAEFKRTPRR